VDGTGLDLSLQVELCISSVETPMSSAMSRLVSVYSLIATSQNY